MLAQQGKNGESLLPLTRLFHPGQLVRCLVTSLRTGGAAEPEARAPAGQKRKRRAPQKLIELSLEVARVCAGVAADEGLREGMALPACVRSVEDHGYTLLLGPQGAEGECASLLEAPGHLYTSLIRVLLVFGSWGCVLFWLRCMRYLEYSSRRLHTLCRFACCQGASGGAPRLKTTLFPFCVCGRGLVHLGTKLHPRLIYNVKNDSRHFCSAPSGKVNNLEILHRTLLTMSCKVEQFT